jgi:hypothetical protein
MPFYEEQHLRCRFSVHDRVAAAHVQWHDGLNGCCAVSYSKRFLTPGRQGNLATIVVNRYREGFVRDINIKFNTLFLYTCLGFALSIAAFGFLQILTAHYIGNAQAARPETSIVTDEGSGDVRVIVKGREVARFDAQGLHVRSAIEYGGLLSDVGEAHYAGDRP